MEPNINQPGQYQSREGQPGQYPPAGYQPEPYQPTQYEPSEYQPGDPMPSPEDIAANPASVDWQLGWAASQAPELQPKIAAHLGASENLLHWIVQNGFPKGQQAAWDALDARAAMQAGQGWGGQAPGEQAPGGQASYGQAPSGQPQPGVPFAPYNGSAPDAPFAPYGAEAKQKSKKTGLIVGLVAGGVVVLLALIFGGIFLARALFAASTPEAAEEAPRDESSEVAPYDNGIPDSSGMVELTTSAGSTVEVPIEASEDGVLVGMADAPVTIDYYFDFSCLHCVAYHEESGEMFQTSIADGDIQVRYHMINIVSEYGVLAGGTAAATVQYEPQNFFAVMDELFEIPSDEQMGMNSIDYAAFAEDAGLLSGEGIVAIEVGSYDDWIRNSTETALADGVGGTPWLAIDGEQLSSMPTTAEELKSAIE